MPPQQTRKFTPEAPPTWRGHMSKFGPVVPPGPALALTKTHVALQQKGTELAFLQDTFTRAQTSWVNEKSEMEDQLRDLRADKAQLERNFQALKSQSDQQKKLHALSEEHWANEKQQMEAAHSLEVSDLKSQLEAMRSTADIVDNRNKKLRHDLMARATAVPREAHDEMTRAAQARIREAEANASAQIQAIWHDRSTLQEENAALMTKVRQLQAELEEERRIREAHMSHSAVLVGDKARMMNASQGRSKSPQRPTPKPKLTPKPKGPPSAPGKKKTASRQQTPAK